MTTGYRRRFPLAIRGRSSLRAIAADLVEDPACAAYWKANRYSGSGALADMSGHGHDAQLGSAAGADTNDPLWLPFTGTRHVYLPGVAGNYLSVPDSAALSITGDITLEVCVALDDWTPAAASNLISKWNPTGNQRSYRFTVTAAGLLQLQFSLDGTNTGTANSTVATGLADGSVRWVRCTRASGSGDVRFWTSPDGSTWAQLGDTVAATSGALFDSTATGGFGATNEGTADFLAAKVYRARIYAADLGSGSGTPALDIDTSQANPAATTFTESSVNAATVTINRSATGRKAVVVDRPLFLLGTDDYLRIADHANLNFAAADSFTVAIAYRAWGEPGAHQILLAKRVITGAGWELAANSANPSRLRGTWHDGSSGVDANAGQSNVRNGALRVATIVRDTTADQVRSLLDGVIDTNPTADTTTGSLSNTAPFRIGARYADADVANYADMEFFAAALFRRALTNAEIVRLGQELLR